VLSWCSSEDFQIYWFMSISEFLRSRILFLLCMSMRILIIANVKSQLTVLNFKYLSFKNHNFETSTLEIISSNEFQKYAVNKRCVLFSALWIYIFLITSFCQVKMKWKDHPFLAFRRSFMISARNMLMRCKK